MGGRWTDDDGTHERHTDINRLTRHTASGLPHILSGRTHHSGHVPPVAPPSTPRCQETNNSTTTQTGDRGERVRLEQACSASSNLVAGRKAWTRPCVGTCDVYRAAEPGPDPKTPSDLVLEEYVLSLSLLVRCCSCRSLVHTRARRPLGPRTSHLELRTQLSQIRPTRVERRPGPPQLLRRSVARRAKATPMAGRPSRVATDSPGAPPAPYQSFLYPVWGMTSCVGHDYCSGGCRSLFRSENVPFGKKLRA